MGVTSSIPAALTTRRLFLSRAFFPLVILMLVMAGCGSGNSSDPAATVNGRDISMTSYDKQVTFLRITSSTGGPATDPCGAKIFAGLCKQLKQTALENLIGNELTAQYASSHHISVSQSDFDTQWGAYVKSQFHADNAVLKAYAKSVGLTVPDMQTSFRQNMLQQRVLYDVTKSMPTAAPSVRLSRLFVSSPTQLKAVRKQLHSGETFNQVAQGLAGDLHGLCAQHQCGDIGWTPDALIPPAESSILSTSVGKIAGPFAGQAGYSLFYIEGRDAQYAVSSTQQLALRQRKFATWLRIQEKRATVHRYVAT